MLTSVLLHHSPVLNKNNLPSHCCADNTAEMLVLRSWIKDCIDDIFSGIQLSFLQAKATMHCQYSLVIYVNSTLPARYILSLFQLIISISVFSHHKVNDVFNRGFQAHWPRTGLFGTMTGTGLPLSVHQKAHQWYLTVHTN